MSCCWIHLFGGNLGFCLESFLKYPFLSFWIVSGAAWKPDLLTTCNSTVRSLTSAADFQDCLLFLNKISSNLFVMKNIVQMLYDDDIFFIAFAGWGAHWKLVARDRGFLLYVMQFGPKRSSMFVERWCKRFCSFHFCLNMCQSCFRHNINIHQVSFMQILEIQLSESKFLAWFNTLGELCKYMNYTSPHNWKPSNLFILSIL